MTSYNYFRNNSYPTTLTRIILFTNSTNKEFKGRLEVDRAKFSHLPGEPRNYNT